MSTNSMSPGKPFASHDCASICENCYWFDLIKSDSTDPDIKYGFCLRYPPVFVGEGGKRDSRTFSTCDWLQPAVSGYCMCGEWTPRGDKPIRGPTIDIDSEFSDYGLPVRVRRALKVLDAKTFRDIINQGAEGFLRVPNFGETALRNLREWLNEKGFELH